MPTTSTTCPQCGAAFVPTRAQQRYCTPACTRRWNKRPEVRAATAAVTTYATTCAVCGAAMTRHIGRRGSATQPACSPRCKGWLATGWPDAPRASVITWATCSCGQTCRRCNASKRDLLLPEWAEWLTTHGRPRRRTVLDRTEARFAHLHPVTVRHKV